MLQPISRRGNLAPVSTRGGWTTLQVDIGHVMDNRAGIARVGVYAMAQGFPAFNPHALTAKGHSVELGEECAELRDEQRP